MNIARRDFLRISTAGALSLIASFGEGCMRSTPVLQAQAPLPTRPFGRTGENVTIISLGGEAAIERPEKEELALSIIGRALDLGVNYIDTAAGYGGDGRCSERFIGRGIKGRRAQVLLATKTHDRTRDGSLRHLEQSLRLLQTDHVDVWQLHNLAQQEMLDRVFSPGGAMQALVDARDQKMVRFLGISGHADPFVLAEAARRFPFDTILMAINAADKHRLSFIDNLLPAALERNMGIVAMKAMGNGRLVFNWKQLARLSRPGNLTPQECLHYVLTLPISTIVIGYASVAHLEENAALARSFKPLTAGQVSELEARTRRIARSALYFRNWV